MRKLIAAGKASAGLLVAGATLAVAAILPLTGAAIAVLTRPKHHWSATPSGCRQAGRLVRDVIGGKRRPVRVGHQVDDDGGVRRCHGHGRGGRTRPAQVPPERAGWP